MTAGRSASALPAFCLCALPAFAHVFDALPLRYLSAGEHGYDEIVALALARP